MKNTSVLALFGIVAFAALAAGIFLLYKQAPAPVVSSYTSEEVGLRFSYAPIYTLNARHDSFQDTDINVITLINASTTVPDMSEGPTAISVIEIPVPEGTDLEAWTRTATISNFYLSQDKTLKQSSVGGAKAYEYTFDGLYASDAVAVMHNGKIYLFFASWIDVNDRIRTDFKNLLSSVTFI